MVINSGGFFFGSVDENWTVTAVTCGVAVGNAILVMEGGGAQEPMGL